MEKALALYNSYGLSCLPVSKDKSPYNVKTWKGGITDPLAYYDAFGIGIICGEASGGLECIDFDNHFGDAKDIISAFIKTPDVEEIYRRHNVPIESTMNGGYHFIYRCEDVGGNQKLARRPFWSDARNRYEPDVLIETRGEGGYFAAAPTPGYVIVRNSFASIPVITPQERGVLLEACRSFNTWIDREKKLPEEEKEKPGDIYNSKQEAIDDAIRCLKGAGWDEVRPGIWRRPGKKDGISATFGKVAPNVFYNFSSSAYPFDHDHGYKPFQVVGLLKYGGDFKAFARELGEKYNDIVRDTRPEKKKEEQLTPSELNARLLKCHIDTSIPIAKPPVIMTINDGGEEWQRLFTLGNFSALTGKGKSKKTFLNTMLLAAAAKNGTIQNKFQGSLPSGKEQVLLFDTEQSRYDAWLTSKRTLALAGLDIPNFGAFALRELTPHQRCEIIEYAIRKMSSNLGLIAIDGIADLATAINDEDEATRVGSLLMRWSSEFNIHIITVIHQNKGDNFATGHLGSMIIKKAEAVIGVEKDTTDRNRSKVTCDNMRGVADFEDFYFEIEDHIPRICDGYVPSKKIPF